MQLSPLFLSLLTVSSALPLGVRQEQSFAPQLLTTINDLNTAVTGLTTAVNNFDGSLLGLLPQALAVVKTETKLDLTILKATHITEKSTNFTAEESTEIVNSLAGGVGPIQASLEALKAKVCTIHIIAWSRRLTITVHYFQKDTHSSRCTAGPHNTEEAHRYAHRYVDCESNSGKLRSAGSGKGYPGSVF